MSKAPPKPFPPRPLPVFADYDIYPCLCSGHQLLHEQGCTCGAWLAAMGSYERELEMHALEVYGATRRMRDFLIKPPTPDITFRTTCRACGHLPHGPGACSVGHCGCPM